MRQPGQLKTPCVYCAYCAQGAESRLLNFPVLPSLRAEEAHLVAQQLCEELKSRLSTTEANGQSQGLKMAAEIEDLNKTKAFLEERLIELIRYRLT